MKYFLFTLGQQQRGVARLGHSTHRAPGTLRSRNSTLVDTLDSNDTYCVYAMIERTAPKDNIFLNTGHLVRLGVPGAAHHHDAQVTGSGPRHRAPVLPPAS